MGIGIAVTEVDGQHNRAIPEGVQATHREDYDEADMGSESLDRSRFSVYLNEDKGSTSIYNYQLNDLIKSWKQQGREVQVSAHENETAGYRAGVPRLRVIVDPPPELPLQREIWIRFRHDLP